MPAPSGPHRRPLCAGRSPAPRWGRSRGQQDAPGALTDTETQQLRCSQPGPGTRGWNRTSHPGSDASEGRGDRCSNNGAELLPGPQLEDLISQGPSQSALVFPQDQRSPGRGTTRAIQPASAPAPDTASVTDTLLTNSWVSCSS